MEKLDKNWIAFALYVALFYGIGVYFNGVANVFPVFIAFGGAWIFFEAFALTQVTDEIFGPCISFLVLFFGCFAFVLMLPRALGVHLDQDSGAVWWQAPDSKDLVFLVRFAGVLLLTGTPSLWFWLTGQMSKKVTAPVPA